jgi:hypothetical protein
VPDYRLDDWGSIRGMGKVFFSMLSIHTSCGVHPASYPVGTVHKGRWGHDADCYPLFAAEVKNE